MKTENNFVFVFAVLEHILLLIDRLVHVVHDHPKLVFKKIFYFYINFEEGVRT